MRKRSFLSVIDKIVWLIIALLPIISYLFCVRLGFSGVASGVSNSPSFSEFCHQFFYSEEFLDLGSSTTSHIFISERYGIVNIFYMFFGYMFGGLEDLGLPFYFNSEPIICCLAWFCTVQIMHFFVDVLLFIPRLCQKFVEVKE